jgi:hypothetical protein
MPITGRAYLSPTLVLLAFDYPEGANQEAFLGFSIERQPGFDGAPFTFLPNRIGFNGPKSDGTTEGSDKWPIQKFYWWDARINTADRGKSFTYTISVVTGTSEKLTIATDPKGSIRVAVTVPHEVENGIGSYFNRAVVSSQAFVSEFGHNPQGEKLHEAYLWLGNGMQQAVADFLDQSPFANKSGRIHHPSYGRIQGRRIFGLPCERRHGRLRDSPTQTLGGKVLSEDQNPHHA